MGLRNYLVEGVSATGKTSVCRELLRRGYQAINGDTELAYQGDPATGDPVAGHTHEHHLWHVDKVLALVAGDDAERTFFCGGSRNFGTFIEAFDGVFVLEIDSDTLCRRLDARREDEWGGRPDERRLVERLHRTKEDVPRGGIVIDATRPLEEVVDEILRLSEPEPAHASPRFEIGSRARKLPAPPSVVWESLANPFREGARPWLDLAADEVAPRILDSHEPDLVVWSSLWPSRPNDEVHLDLAASGSETSLRFTLLTPDEPPDESRTGHLRHRLNHLLFADLRFSYGQ